MFDIITKNLQILIPSSTKKTLLMLFLFFCLQALLVDCRERDYFGQQQVGLAEDSERCNGSRVPF
jgi:hypothetical protein